METILLGIFITGYLLITLEHSLKIDKLIVLEFNDSFMKINAQTFMNNILLKYHQIQLVHPVL